MYLLVDGQMDTCRGPVISLPLEHQNAGRLQPNSENQPLAMANCHCCLQTGPQIVFLDTFSQGSLEPEVEAH